ncbi:HAMP domain-containing protein [Cupriavidus sp. BIC8F]|uniref:HAMP domain-containing protein n=1 Tax=Cupriavidus sp. BIC8F TaxID=3079014 RepID=UPI00291679C4|nr:HAMP domain-containing protein [Cupriavidus sp. BIC8F]
MVDRLGNEDTVQIDAKDADGKTWVRDMNAAKDGAMINKVAVGNGAPAERITAFVTYPEWQWLIAGSVPTASLRDELEASRNRFLAGGLLVALAVSAAFWWLLRRMVSQPLAQAADAAGRLASGDLTARLDTPRNDEIGQLMRAIDGVGQGLTEIVDKVCGSVSAIAGSRARSPAATPTCPRELHRRRAASSGPWRASRSSQPRSSKTPTTRTTPTRPWSALPMRRAPAVPRWAAWWQRWPTSIAMRSRWSTSSA